MAVPTVRVFGKPITDGTRTQRALAAKNNQNADGMLNQVLQFTNQQLQKAAAGGGQTATTNTTYGRIYNATAETLTYMTAYDWEGNVAGQYPVSIENGQWAVFEHVGTHGPNRQGSVAAVVYNIEDRCDSMISWKNPVRKHQGFKTNTAYCEMNYPEYFNYCNWDEIYKNLMVSGTESNAEFDGYSTKVTIDEGENTSSYSAYFYRDV